MQFKQPKDDNKYQWTNHVKQKMLYYGISESLIKRITRAPKRIETGIAPNTIAVMQPRGTKQKPHEVWVMYQLKSPIVKSKITSDKKIIISSWRYPGVSPFGKKIEIPEDVLMELAKYEEE